MMVPRWAYSPNSSDTQIGRPYPLHAHNTIADSVFSVKALATLRIALPTSSAQQRTSTDILVTISSDGRVLVYDVHALVGLQSDVGAVPQLAALAEYDTAGSRLTCLTVAEDPIGPSDSTAISGMVTHVDEAEGVNQLSEDEAALEGEAEPEEEDEAEEV